MNAPFEAVAGLTEVGRGPVYVVARNEHVLVVHVFGDLNDELSEGWRTAAQRSFDKDGYPPFGIVDAVQGRSLGSLQGRMRSAAFLKRTAGQMRRIALLGTGQGSFVFRTVMRVAGAANVELVADERAAEVLAAMREGLDPFDQRPFDQRPFDQRPTR